MNRKDMKDSKRKNQRLNTIDVERLDILDKTIDNNHNNIFKKQYR